MHCIWLSVIYSGMIGDTRKCKRGLDLIEKYSAEYFDNKDASSVEQPDASQQDYKVWEACIASPHWEACKTCKNHGDSGCVLPNINVFAHSGDWILCRHYKPV